MSTESFLFILCVFCFLVAIYVAIFDSNQYFLSKIIARFSLSGLFKWICGKIAYYRAKNYLNLLYAGEKNYCEDFWFELRRYSKTYDPREHCLLDNDEEF